ncbi:MAG TPA: putative baseplate assembly protein [Streptosporangiaceae bacterium]
MIYQCCSDARRALVAGAPAVNGIDFLEVLDDPSLPDDRRQRRLYLHFVNPVEFTLTAENLTIEGGERIRGIQVVAVLPTDDPSVLAVDVDRPGDFSGYTLRLVSGTGQGASPGPPPGIDPVLSEAGFSFKVACLNDLDCLRPNPCPADLPDEPDIDYLAKDYESFRQLLLDRMAVIDPRWDERHAADLGVVLVELLAYVADHLSYRQDAVTTEAYLGTARKRISVRRLARLVDYRMHDGCNARAWVQVAVGADVPPSSSGQPALPEGTQFLTSALAAGLPVALTRDSLDYGRALGGGALAFEAMHDMDGLYRDHNEMPFYTWSGRDCCLPAGATSATLRGTYPNLQVGDVLILMEVRGAAPPNGEADADPTRRHAVRLTAVSYAGLSGPLTDRLTGQAVTEIAWGGADALPFPLCISSGGSDDPTGATAVDVAMALGNIVLCDHGASENLSTAGSPEQLGPVPGPRLRYAQSPSGPCSDTQAAEVPARFRPSLATGPVTQQGTIPNPRYDPNHPLADEPPMITFDEEGPASGAFQWPVSSTSPAIALGVQDDQAVWEPLWQPQQDLLGASPDNQVFVVEIDDDGQAFLRFGDDTFGKRPPEGTVFLPRYRVGNGAVGNVGPGAISHLVADNLGAVVSSLRRDPGHPAIWNPLPAAGGTDPETIESVQQRAPYAFRVQERAVTPEDFADVATGLIADGQPEIQTTLAERRWTGSWRTVFVTVDRYGGLDVDDQFKAGLLSYLEQYRLAGEDLEIEGPVYVPLELDLLVQLAADSFRSQVNEALLAVLNNQTLPDGSTGLFHPDRFTFGQPVYLSPVLAAAQAVAGVTSVQATGFGRWGSADLTTARDAGVLQLERAEIARLDNDARYPDRGVLRLTLAGGR